MSRLAPPRVHTLALLAILLLSAVPRAVSAAPDTGGGWLWLEVRQRLHKPTNKHPLFAIRAQADLRFNTHYDDGLYQGYLRLGLMMVPTSWLWISMNGTGYADRVKDDVFDVEYRLEQEIYFTPKFGPVQFMNRHRIEWRFRDDQDAKLRYRTLLRIQYEPTGLRYRPFVWNEWLIDSRSGYHDNRLVAGIQFVLPGASVLDVGYMFHLSHLADGWNREHNLLVSFTANLPGHH